MSMTKLQIAAVGAVLLGGSGALYWEHRSNEHPKSELARLEQDAGQTARPAEGGKAPAASVASRTPESISPQAPGTPGGMPSAAATRMPENLAPGLTPVESLGNAGRATARSAFATQLWAAHTGNVELESSTLLLSAAERQKLLALRQTLPPDIQAQYPTPEDLLAFALAGSPRPVAGMEVLGETDQGPDDVTLQTAWQHEGDSYVHHNAVQFHQEPDGWKLVVPPPMVDLAVAYLGRQ
jgi:hypothetical protein